MLLIEFKKMEKGGTYYSQAKKYCKDKTSSPLEPMAQMENGTNGERMMTAFPFSSTGLVSYFTNAV